MHRIGQSFLIGLALAVASPASLGSDRLVMSGFGTLGAVHVDQRDLFFNHPAKPRDGADRPDWGADSVLGVQGSFALADRTGATMQILSSDSHDRNYRPRVSWAFLHHDLNPNLTVRAGRLRTPFFMHSESLNIGFAHPWVRPPVEVYGLNPFNDMDGVDLLFTRRLGGVDIEVQPYVGYESTLEFPDGDASLRRIQGINLNMSHGRLSGQLGYGRARLKIRYGDPLFDLIGALSPDTQAQLAGSDARASFTSLGVRWDDGDLLVIAEFARRSVDRYVASANGWHLTTAYRVGPLTPFVTFARQRQSKGAISRVSANPMLGAVVDAYLESRNQSQRSVTLGARWDIHPQTALKAEWSRVEVDKASWGAFFPNDLTSASPAGRTVKMFSLSMDFVF
ncbi:porin [Rhodocyclaceae bacterium SMB388]